MDPPMAFKATATGAFIIITVAPLSLGALDTFSMSSTVVQDGP